MSLLDYVGCLSVGKIWFKIKFKSVNYSRQKCFGATKENIATVSLILPLPCLYPTHGQDDVTKANMTVEGYNLSYLNIYCFSRLG